MKAFYEDSRERDAQVKIMRNYRHTTSAHFHNNVELYVLEKGEQEITCNGKSYLMRSGDVAFFDCYDIHGYVPTAEACENSCVLIIPFSLLTNFRAFRKRGRVASPIIQEEGLAKRLLAIVDGFLVEEGDKNVVGATVDLLLAILEKHLDYATDEKEDVALVKQILGFIEENYRGDARLSTIASHLGYTEEHLSREFHRFLKQSIPSYVNRLRLDYVENELKKGEKTLAELIYEAGFNNFQTYYRNKKSAEERK